MSQNSPVNNVADQNDKKPYVRPELVKHGKVETLTQLQPPTTSIPWNI